MVQTATTVDQVLVINGQDSLTSEMRVGIDTLSADHAYIVRLMSRGIDVEFVKFDYSNGLDQLLRGEFDATVWTAADLPPLPEHITTQPIRNVIQTDAYLQKLGEAVILGRTDSKAVVNILQSTVDVSRVQQIQVEVLDRKRRPTY